MLEAKLSVHVPAVPDDGYVYDERRIVDAVDDTPVPDTNSPEILRALELLAAGWAGCFCQGFDTFEHAGRNRPVEVLQLLSSGARYSNRVVRHELDVSRSAATDP